MTVEPGREALLVGSCGALYRVTARGAEQLARWSKALIAQDVEVATEGGRAVYYVSFGGVVARFAGAAPSWLAPQTCSSSPTTSEPKAAPQRPTSERTAASPARLDPQSETIGVGWPTPSASPIPVTWLDRRPGRGGRVGDWVRRLRLRWCWLALGVSLHLGIALTMRLGIFPFGVLALYPLLRHPDELERVVTKARRRLGRKANEPPK